MNKTENVYPIFVTLTLEKNSEMFSKHILFLFKE